MVVVASSRSCAPEIEEKSCKINQRLMHNVASKACWEREDPREPSKDTWLPYSAIESKFLVTSLTPGANNVKKLRLIDRWIWYRKRVDRDINMRRSPVIFKSERP
jgi:hypothetical protein